MMLFADDLVICENSRAEVELQLERWRETFESHGLNQNQNQNQKFIYLNHIVLYKINIST